MLGPMDILRNGDQRTQEDASEGDFKPQSTMTLAEHNMRNRLLSGVQSCYFVFPTGWQQALET